jgi:hypothetical protein
MLKTNLTFNAGQLTLIHTCAQECIGDGTPSRISDEWAVFETVKFASESFEADQLVIMHLIARECEKRHLGAMSVYGCAAIFNDLYEGEDLPEYPALVARVVNTYSPETAPRVIFGEGSLPALFARIDLGHNGMGPFSLN